MAHAHAAQRRTPLPTDRQARAARWLLRESGGHVAFTAMDDPLGAPLDLEPRSPVVAARTPEALAELSRLPA